MGALNSIPFCSRNRDDNNNLPSRPDLNLQDPVVVESQPEATSTPKHVRVEDAGPDPAPVQPISPSLEPIHSFIHKQNSVSADSGYDQSLDGPLDGPLGLEEEVPARSYQPPSLDDQPPSLGDQPPSLDDQPPRLEEQNILDMRVDEDEDEEVDLQSEEEGQMENKLTKEEMEEMQKIKNEEEEVEKKEKKRMELRRESSVDLKQLEAEVLGEDLVEPVTGLEEDQQDLHDEKVFSKTRDTTDLITDMLNQMVVDGGSRDLSAR